MQRELLSLIVSACLAFPLVSTHAKPRPAFPPWPEWVLFQARFDNLFETAPAGIEATTVVESWSDYAIAVGQGGGVLWSGNGPDGNPVIMPDTGSVRFWYAPPWNSGERKGSDSTILSLATITKSATPWLQLHVTADGSAIGLTDAKGSVLAAAKIEWKAETWHQIAVTYSEKETQLFVDGQLAATGSGVTVALTKRSILGVSLGSAPDGTAPTEGSYDEFYTFAFALTPEDISWNYNGVAAAAAKGPISAEEEAETELLLAQARAERAALLAMQPLDAGLDSCPCVTNGPLHLTNITFYATNDVEMRLEGGQPNTLYDVFRTTALGSNYVWAWIWRGYQCEVIVDTNAPLRTAFYLAADTTDSDSDGLTDAYEHLVYNRTNLSPGVAITSPVNNVSLAAPTNITVTFSTTNCSPGASTTLYVNGTAVAATLGNAVTWPDPEPGSYDLTARVVDTDTAWATSIVTHVTITLPELASLKCWLKAEALPLTNGATITNWADASGNGNNATATGASTQRPTLATNQVNGLPAVRFNGANLTYLHLPTFLTNQGEAIIVFKPLGQVNQPLWSITTNTQPTSYTTNGATDSFGSSTATVLGSYPEQLGFHIYNVSSSTNGWTARINGRIVKNATPNTPAFGNNFNLGCALYNQTWYYGSHLIAEVLFYNKTLTDEQRIAIGRALNRKYNLVTNAPSAAITCSGPDPMTINVSWSPAYGAANYTLVRRESAATTTLLTADSQTTNFTDTISSSGPISYELTTRSYAGTATNSLTTPLMDFTAPVDKTTYYVGQTTTVSFTPHQEGIGGMGGEIFTPALVEVYANGQLYTNFTDAPYSCTIPNTSPRWWNFRAKAFDSAGNSRFGSVRGVNVINDLDSDGDGVTDSQDYFPYDPTRWQQPPANPNDHTPPTITITEP